MSNSVAQRGAGSCDAERGLASYCGGVRIYLVRNPQFRRRILEADGIGEDLETSKILQKRR